MANREVPYGAFNYVINFDGAEVFGGFSDVSGIGTEIKIAEYRNGNEKENHVRKVAGISTCTDVTCKRGIVNSKTLWDWINEIRREGSQKSKNVSITLRDEAGNDVQIFKLSQTVVSKYVGPTLAGKGGGDVAMEELTLASEGLEIEAAGG